jgi:hypothetical protein
VLARGRQVAETFELLDRADPDAARKIRILASREDVRAPVLRLLADESGSRAVFLRELQDTRDVDLSIRWEDISGPVGV